MKMVEIWSYFYFQTTFQFSYYHSKKLSVLDKNTPQLVSFKILQLRASDPRTPVKHAGWFVEHTIKLALSNTLNSVVQRIRQQSSACNRPYSTVEHQRKLLPCGIIGSSIRNDKCSLCSLLFFWFIFITKIILMMFET